MMYRSACLGTIAASAKLEIFKDSDRDAEGLIRGDPNALALAPHGGILTSPFRAARRLSSWCDL